MSLPIITPSTPSSDAVSVASNDTEIVEPEPQTPVILPLTEGVQRSNNKRKREDEEDEQIDQEEQDDTESRPSSRRNEHDDCCHISKKRNLRLDLLPARDLVMIHLYIVAHDKNPAKVLESLYTLELLGVNSDYEVTNEVLEGVDARLQVQKKLWKTSSRIGY